MALFKCDFHSTALMRCCSVYAIIPQRDTNGQIGVTNTCKDEKYKCLLLLHGLSDDESIWLRRTSIERYAAEHGIAVIMPCGERSFYTDMKSGAGDYYTYVAKEVPAIAKEFFNLSDKKEDWFVAGLSMGGYGALKIALRENNSFAAAAGLSSVADIVGRSKPTTDGFIGFYDTLVPVFGKDMIIPAEDDLFRLSSMKAESGEKLPRLYMACGTEDFMYEDNIRLKSHIESLGIDFTFEENEGYSHTWDYWDMLIRKIIKWFVG